MPFKSSERYRKYMSDYRRSQFAIIISERGSWQQILIEALGGKCMKCGVTDELELDHIKPLSFGGKHELSNIQVLCEKCHKEKTDVERRENLSSNFFAESLGHKKNIRYPYYCKCGLGFSSKLAFGKHILKAHPYWLRDY